MGRPRPSEADPDEDARWKWGPEENYVDGDDVRDPETGAVHPEFVEVLEHLGITYADVSQSDAEIHAIYRKNLSEGVKQASWQLDDEPWGANRGPPEHRTLPRQARLSHDRRARSGNA